MLCIIQSDHSHQYINNTIPSSLDHFQLKSLGLMYIMSVSIMLVQCFPDLFTYMIILWTQTIETHLYKQKFGWKWGAKETRKLRNWTLGYLDYCFFFLSKIKTIIVRIDKGWGHTKLLEISFSVIACHVIHMVILWLSCSIIFIFKIKELKYRG